ncbi:MAG: hemolysin XhlA family protein [Crocosphaera sp.]|nr:hemolysin XhlA family protein [Crocosphaera sp.]
MNEPVTVTYSIGEVLKRIEDKIDSNQKQFKEDVKELKQDIKDVNTKLETLNTKVNNIEVKLTGIETEVKNLKEDVTELKGSTKAQIWTLIGILVTAVSGFIVAVARFVFYPIT